MPVGIEQLLDSVSQQYDTFADNFIAGLNDNVIFQGGLALGIIGTVGFALKRLFGFLWKRIVRHFTFRVYVEERGESLYYSIGLWLNEHHPKAARSLLAEIVDADSKTLTHSVGHNYGLRLTFTNDDHVIWYRGWPLLMTHTQEKLENASNFDNLYAKRLQIRSFLGKRKIKRLLEHVTLQYENRIKRARSVSFYAPSESYGWSHARSREVELLKTFDHIFFEGKEALSDDLKQFLERRDWYRKRRIAYRRGYLLHGPPGTGKTTTAVACADLLGWDEVYTLSLGSIKSDSRLYRLMSEVEDNSVILIEDVDAAVGNTDRENQSEDKTASNISLEALLNVLDGPRAPENCVIILTTNYVDRLDSALKRPGRCDFHMEVSLPRYSDIKSYMELFYSADLANIFISYDMMDRPGCSLAQAQEICISNASSAESALYQISGTEYAGSKLQMLLPTAGPRSYPKNSVAVEA